MHDQDTSQDTKWTWIHITRGPKHEAVKLLGPRQKMREFARQGHISKLRGKRCQGPTWSSANIQESARSVVEEDGPELGQKGPGPAHADRPTPFLAWFVMPFDLDAPWLIYSPCLRQSPHPFIIEPPNCKKHIEESRCCCEYSTLPWRWHRLDPSRHCWPYVVKPWWCSGAIPWIHQGTCTCDGDIHLIFPLLFNYFDAGLLSFIYVARIWS
jgi:hypothetical protein